MAASSIRFGPGVTKEVGMDFKNMGAQARLCRDGQYSEESRCYEAGGGGIDKGGC